VNDKGKQDKEMALPTITAIGNLVFEPDFGVTANGISRCKMRIACNERKKQDGEWVDGDTSFFDIIVWRGLADAAGDNFKKGQSILVVGKVKISKYEDKNGVEKQSVEILADEIAAVVKGKKSVTNPTDDPWL
jgi:single-strand DNA-binding protein